MKEIAALLGRMNDTKENYLDRQRLRSELKVKQERLDTSRVLRRQVERVVLAEIEAFEKYPPEEEKHGKVQRAQEKGARVWRSPSL